MKSDRADIAATIATLVRDATPVEPLDVPAARAGRWALAAAAVAVLAVALLGVRPDAVSQLGRPWFATRAALTLVMALAGGMVAMQMSVPGLPLTRGARVAPWVSCLGWGALLTGALASTGAPLHLLLHARAHVSCALCIAGIGLVPGVVLVRMLRQAAPLDARWIGGCAGLASAAAGALATQFVCTNDAAEHHLVWHLAPVMCLALAQLALAPRLFAPRIRR